LHVRPHSLFQRQGSDLFCEVPVSLDVALLGGEIQVPTIEGWVNLKLGARHGKREAVSPAGQGGCRDLGLKTPATCMCASLSKFPRTFPARRNAS